MPTKCISRFNTYFFQRGYSCCTLSLHLTVDNGTKSQETYHLGLTQKEAVPPALGITVQFAPGKEEQGRNKEKATGLKDQTEQRECGGNHMIKLGLRRHPSQPSITRIKSPRSVCSHLLSPSPAYLPGSFCR